MSPPPPLRSSRHPRQVHHASARTVSKRTELTTPGSDGLRDLIIHDIRTPLAAISGHAQLLRRRCSSAEPKAAELLQAMQVIERAATRIDQLLDELADIAPPADAGQDWLCRQPVDLLALTRRMSRYRGSNVTNQVRGTGLGLARASELVALHGGTVALESTLGVGTTVTVRLPLDD